MIHRVVLMLKLLVLIVLSLPAGAQSQVPHIFSDGTPAHASDVNANFAALSQRIDALEVEIARLNSSNVAGHTYNVEISTTAISRFDADPQNSASDPGFWNIDLYSEKYTLKFNDNVEKTAILKTKEDRGGDLRPDGSLLFAEEPSGTEAVYYWTQTGSSISLSETPSGNSIVSMYVEDGASTLQSIFSEQKINNDTGSDSCGNGTERCYGDEFQSSILIGIRTIANED
jgi:hypothetical protein